MFTSQETLFFILICKHVDKNQEWINKPLKIYNICIWRLWKDDSRWSSTSPSVAVRGNLFRVLAQYQR